MSKIAYTAINQALYHESANLSRAPGILKVQCAELRGEDAHFSDES